VGSAVKLRPVHLLVLFAAVAACGGQKRLRPSDAARIDGALEPAHLATAMQTAGGGRLHATLRMAVGRPGEALESVTTTTDLMLDRSGQYRMAETNDRDGGRDVVLHGHDLHVALRYGKMIRRRAEGGEPARLLHEGLGGPWAAWDLLRRAATLDAAAGSLHVRLGDGAQAAGPAAVTGPTTTWRDTAVIDALEGSIVLDPTSGALRTVDLKGAFHAVRGGGEQVRGEVELHAKVEALGPGDSIKPPPEAEDLVTRQRTVPDQKALLGGGKP
jgi:hypothetical protein